MFNEDFEKENLDIIEKIKGIRDSKLKPDFDEILFAKLDKTEYKRPFFLGKFSFLMLFFNKFRLAAKNIKKIFFGKVISSETTGAPSHEKKHQTKKHYRVVPILAAASLLFLVSFLVYKYFGSYGAPKLNEQNITQITADTPKVEKKSLRIFNNDIPYNEWSSTNIKKIPNKEYWIELSKDIHSYLGHGELSSTQVMDAIRIIKGNKFKKEIKRIASLKQSKIVERMDTIALYIKLDPIVTIGVLSPKVMVYPK